MKPTSKSNISLDHMFDQGLDSFDYSTDTITALLELGEIKTQFQIQKITGNVDDLHEKMLEQIDSAYVMISSLDRSSFMINRDLNSLLDIIRGNSVQEIESHVINRIKSTLVESLNRISELEDRLNIADSDRFKPWADDLVESERNHEEYWKPLHNGKKPA